MSSQVRVRAYPPQLPMRETTRGTPAQGGAVAGLHAEVQRRLASPSVPAMAIAMPLDERIIAGVSRLAGPVALFAAVAFLIRLI